MSESSNPAEPEVGAPPGSWRRRVVRLSVVAMGLTMLTCGGGGWWWVSRPDFGDAVREAGGRYRREVMETPLSMFSNVVNGRPHTVFHWILFDRGDIDDEWLHAHREEISRLSSLTLLLRNAAITGDGLNVLSDMQNLHCLDLTGTQLEDPDVSQLPNVTVLYIGHTGITGAVLGDLAQIPNLGFLSIDSTQVTEEGISGLNSCRTLNSLMILDAEDDVVRQVAGMNGLQHLMLQGQDITADSLPVLQGMQNLQLLTLYDSNLSDEEIEQLQQALPACIVQQLDSELLEQMRESAWE